MKVKVWFNFGLVNFAEAGINEAGWPEDSGIFETIKTVDGKPWALTRHMRRALKSARALDIDFPNEDLVRSATMQTIAANLVPVGRLRLFFASDGTFRVTHQAYQELSGAAKLMIFPNQVDSDLTILKKYPYTENLRLLHNAQSSGFDDGILINRRDELCESAISNLLFLTGREWITPPLISSVLPGVMRALVIENLGVKVAPILRSDLPSLKAGFLISSLRIAQPILRIEHFELEIARESNEMQQKIAEMALITSVG